MTNPDRAQKRERLERAFEKLLPKTKKKSRRQRWISVAADTLLVFDGLQAGPLPNRHIVDETKTLTQLKEFEELCNELGGQLADYIDHEMYQSTLAVWEPGNPTELARYLRHFGEYAASAAAKERERRKKRRRALIRPAKGRPRERVADKVTGCAAHYFKKISGRKPRRNFNGGTGQESGSFLALVEEVFDTLGVTASAAHYVRLYSEKHMEKRTRKA